MTDGREIITESRNQCMKTCLKKAWYSYKVGIRKDRPSAPLRMGSAFHKGKELIRLGKTIEEALLEALKPYETVPAYSTEYDWAIEREKVLRLLHGHVLYYANDGLVTVAAEQEFRLPILNPDTGSASTIHVAGGKIDGIVTLPDGRLAVEETKTSGQDIAPESDYWRRLQIDSQITRYVWAARQIRHGVSCVLYDVIRKPTIEPLTVPLLDSDGLKVVLDAEGQRVFKANGQPRLSADAEKGYVLQSRKQTPQEYGDRLSDDIAARPEFYYQRKEIARSDADVAMWEQEQWHQHQMLSTCERRGHWFRNTGACLSPYRCEFLDLCCSNWQETDPVPEGFKKLDFVHPELQGEEE